MPSLKAKKVAEESSANEGRRPRKAPASEFAPADRAVAADAVVAAAASDRACAVSGGEQVAAVVQDEVPKRHDGLDYSRFKGIGDGCKAERMQSGDVTWEELSGEQKKEVWKAEEQMEEILDQKRREEDDWRRQLKEKPADLSWVQGRHFTSYEAFCVGRVEATVKKAGNEAFKSGDLDQARENWQGGVDMLLALGKLTPEAVDLLCVLRNNLAQLFVQRQEWNKVKELTDKILDSERTNEKALYRRAQAFFAFSIWDKCELDLDSLLKLHSGNKDAALMLQQVHRKLGKDRRTLGGKAVNDIAAGLEELSADGTVRKLRVEEYGEGDPDERPQWVKQDWLSNGREKVVVTCQIVIWSHGGEELYNSKEYRPHPETKQARDELKEYMDMVNFLDQEGRKMPRLVGDFYRKVKKRPVRWYLGDPGMYKGFDLAVRSMKPKERALFEIDQPALSPSVDKFYQKVGFHSGIAGLPQLVYHIEEERLAILEDEVPEDELDLENKTQRGVRAELQLLGYVVFRDVSPDGDGAKLHSVLHPGLPDAPVVRRGDLLRGAFFINRPFDGSLLVQNQYVEWRLGVDEGKYEKLGDNKEPLRPDGGAFVPKCVGQAILEVDWAELRAGALLEVRYRSGPELYEIAPQYAKQFEQARRESHKKGRKGGAMCSVLVQVFSPGFTRDENSDVQGGTVVDESVPKDMELD
mmetsp:Transcript_81808/g.213385  ORF Transcript_81808/g.213385 Transcript_81808/m.213385 type:complete len:696 (+) Transcript_81808:3-2090(+)